MFLIIIIYPDTQRAAAIKAVDSMAKCCNKRKRQIDENDENKEKCLLLDTSNVSYLMTPFILIIV